MFIADHGEYLTVVIDLEKGHSKDSNTHTETTGQMIPVHRGHGEADETEGDKI